MSLMAHASLPFPLRVAGEGLPYFYRLLSHSFPKTIMIIIINIWLLTIFSFILEHSFSFKLTANTRRLNKGS